MKYSTYQIHLLIYLYLYLTLHILVNLLGVLGLMPLTGVPLPFFSYGGSFALNAIVMIGITEKVAVESQNKKLRDKITNL